MSPHDRQVTPEIQEALRSLHHCEPCGSQRNPEAVTSEGGVLPGRDEVTPAVAGISGDSNHGGSPGQALPGRFLRGARPLAYAHLPS